VRHKTGHDPVENARQEKMTFVDAEKYIRDGVEYTVTYEASGLVTCAALDEIQIPEPGTPGWVSYKITFGSLKPTGNLKFKTIKISPHSEVGKALVKKNDPK
jgi:hypothetical protein